MSAGKAFFDTNILLYMFGGDFPAKSEIARNLFREHAAAGTVLLSTQVVQEFYVSGSRKLKMSRTELLAGMEEFFELPVIVLGIHELRSAMRIEERYRISFWDALIVAAAERGGADVLYTEDLSDGQRYGVVLARNPFRGRALS